MALLRRELVNTGPGDWDLGSVAVLFAFATWLTLVRAERVFGEDGVDGVLLLVKEGEELLPRGTMLELSSMTCDG